MRISLIVPNTRYKNDYLWSVLPSRGLLCLASILRENGYEVNIIDADIDNLSNDDVCTKIRFYDPQIIGITINTFQANSGTTLATELKKQFRDKYIVVGGPHPSALRSDLLVKYKSIDVVCFGESEETIIEVADTIKKGNSFSEVKGICYRDENRVSENAPRHLIQNLDDLPFPAYDLAEDLRRYPGAQPVFKPPSMHIMASRGCPFKCNFCSHSVWGNTVRYRTPSNVIDEIIMLHTKYGINEVFFQDDTMNLNRKWFLEICQMLINSGLNKEMAFKCPFRVDRKLIDEEILFTAKEAGFWIIFYGVESGNQEVLDKISKGTKLSDIKRAFYLTRKVGLKTIAAFMVGNLGETSSTVNDSINLAKEIEPDVIGFSVATPIPGTEFYNIAIKNGWIESDEFSNYSQFEPVCRNETLSCKEIKVYRDGADEEIRNYFREKNALEEIKKKQKISNEDFIYEIAHSFEADERGVKEFLSPYIKYFCGCQKVLDLGCGRGYFLDLLKESGIKGIGIDTDPKFVDFCKGKGHEAITVDVIDYISSDSGYVDGIFCSHIIEHLPAKDGVMFIRNCANKLGDGGVLIIITPNISNEIVRDEIFWLDITHVRPYPFRLLKIIFEELGLSIIHGGVENNNLNTFIVGKKDVTSSLSAKITKTEMIKRNYDHHLRMSIAHQQSVASNTAESIDRNDNNSYEKILNFVPNGGRCLELGAAYGRAFDYLLKKFSHVDGIELFEPAVKEARKRGYSVYLSTLEEMPVEDSMFDVVASRHVMEHTYDPDKAINEIRRVLKTGGHIAAITPHYFPDPEIAHITKFRIDEWEDVYRRNGFKIIHSSLESFNCDEFHIVAQKIEWAEEIDRLTELIENQRLTKEERVKIAVEVGYHYVYTDLLEKAIDAFKLALSADSSNERIYNDLGTLYWATGCKDEAIKMFREAYRIKPDDIYVLFNLIKVMVEFTEFKYTDDLMEKLLKISPYIGSDMLIKYGSELIRNGKPIEARKMLRCVLKNRPEFIEVKEMLNTIDYHLSP